MHESICSVQAPRLQNRSARFQAVPQMSQLRNSSSAARRTKEWRQSETIGASYNAADHVALQPGSTLGPYEILSLIGADGMGEVWLATEVRLGRKVVPEGLTSGPHARAAAGPSVRAGGESRVRPEPPQRLAPSTRSVRRPMVRTTSPWSTWTRDAPAAALRHPPDHPRGPRDRNTGRCGPERCARRGRHPSRHQALGPSSPRTLSISFKSWSLST